MANYAYVENNQIVGVYDFLPNNWRNVSNFYTLENEIDYLKTLGWYKIVKSNPEYNPAIQKLDYPFQWIENDVVYESQQVIDLPPIQPGPKELTPEEISSATQLRIDRQWNRVRAERDRRIKEFEWRYLRYDREVRLNLTPKDDLQKMDTYIQALADITLQPDPFKIIYPEYK